MKLLALGPTQQSSAAMEIILRAAWPGVSLLHVDRHPQGGLPDKTAHAADCRACIIDLLGLGWTRWNAERALALRDFLSGRPAIVLLPALDEAAGWASPDPSYRVLHHPLTVPAMREALLHLRAIIEPSVASVAPRPGSGTLAPPMAPLRRPDEAPLRRPDEVPLRRAPDAPPRPNIDAQPSIFLPVKTRSSATPSADGFALPDRARLPAAPLADAPMAAATPPLPAQGASALIAPTRRIGAARSASARAMARATNVGEMLREIDLRLEVELRGTAAKATVKGSAFKAMTAPLPRAVARSRDVDIAATSRPLASPRVGESLVATAPSVVALPGHSISPTAAIAQTAASAASAASAPIVTTASVGPSRLTAEAHLQVRLACPAVDQMPYLKLILELVLRNAPVRLQVSPQTAAVFCPAQNWVASNIPTSFRRRLTQHKLMVKLIDLQSINVAQANEQALALSGRRADGRRPLDAFLWGLVYYAFENDVPPVAGELSLHLSRLPNFTRLPDAPEVFLRLAVACLGRERTLASLLREFRVNDSGSVRLFVLCAMLSGMANGELPRQLHAPSREVRAGTVSGAAAAPHQPAKPGLLKSLLGRIF